MKNTARKTRPTEAIRPQLRTVLGEAARNAQLTLDLGDLMRRDLREFVISAGTAALAMVLERERTRNRRAAGAQGAQRARPTSRGNEAVGAPGDARRVCRPRCRPCPHDANEPRASPSREAPRCRFLARRRARRDARGEATPPPEEAGAAALDDERDREPHGLGAPAIASCETLARRQDDLAVDGDRRRRRCDAFPEDHRRTRGDDALDAGAASTRRRDDGCSTTMEGRVVITLPDRHRDSEALYAPQRVFEGDAEAREPGDDDF